MAVNKCIKYLLFLFNLLFWISGCIILGVSIYLKVSKNGNSITNTTLPFVNLLIAIGAIIMVLGFLGCCGAIKENRCMLMLFFVSLLLIFILLLVTGILGAVGAKNSKSMLTDVFTPMIPLSGQPAEIQSELNDLQAQVMCCGLVNGPNDWGNTVPNSCSCVNTTQPCVTIGSQSVYSTPCIQFLTNLVERSAIISLGIAFAIAVLMLFGMAFAMTLYCQIGKGSISGA
ncbi:tetraspanin-8 [Esox lucius]|uniref:Tetraspanin n=1 Tax=Esox lucius TaxID=8010 RepID=A0AAY5KF66_ESOLU|nr:tetraspanin-8 [Esox lucius]